MDKIRLLGVECRCRIGVPGWERRKPQKLLLDVCLAVPLRAAGQSDDFKKTPDYCALETRLRVLAERSRFQLIEALAEALAKAALAFDRRIRRVEITVRKTPIVMPKTREVSVEIVRKR